MPTNGGGKRFVQITREDFETFLKRRPEYWGPVSPPRVNEMVYRTAQFAPQDDDLSLWCYSSIDKTTGHARKKGSDAIRLVAVYNDNVHLKYGEKKTLRIQTWRKNLSKKITSMIQRGKDGIMFCPDCGDVMVRREGKYGEFWGCNSYPKCQKTIQIKD